MLHVRSLEEPDQYLMMATRMGTVKRITLQSINTARKSGIRALSLEEGDQLISAAVTDGAQDVLLLTHQGMAHPVPRVRRALHGPGRRGRPWHQAQGRGLAHRRRDRPARKALFSVPRTATASDQPRGIFLPRTGAAQGVKGYQCTQKTGYVAGVAMVAEKPRI